jgi:hypothetical protein
VQRYLPQILDSALSSHLATQAAAVDIIGFTIRQGLAHPLQVRVLPGFVSIYSYICSLSASPLSLLLKRATIRPSVRELLLYTPYFIPSTRLSSTRDIQNVLGRRSNTKRTAVRLELFKVDRPRTCVVLDIMLSYLPYRLSYAAHPYSPPAPMVFTRARETEFSSRLFEGNCQSL